jgi:KEOPS complex subunit Cgi121
MDVKVIGMRGNASFDTVVKHFTSMGGEVVLLDPGQVYGKDMLLSAADHAERAFRHGTNRSKNILTETIIYAASERQISKMKPKEGATEFVAVLFDIEDPKLDAIGMERDDSLIEGTPEKAERLGLVNDMGIPCEDLALERVALLDLAKF